MDDTTYTTYFNHGYFLSKKEPTVLKHFLVATKDQINIQEPLKAGMDEYKKEQLNERLQQLKDKRNELDWER